MVFPSIPSYLDPTHQWHQQQQQAAAAHQSGSGIIGATSFQLLSHPPPQAGGGAGSVTVTVRPGSMADRARMANLPAPETALKCPRCESTNTKFCYFNNYSLSQPRHFCKTCRRYWTRGGALRSVPVGGGYRRNNKRNKSSSSKSPVNSQCQPNSELSAGEAMRLNYSAISTTNEGSGDSTHPIGISNFLGFDQMIQWRPQLQFHQTQPAPLLSTSSGRLLGNGANASSSYNIGQIQKKMEEAKVEENGQQVNDQGKPFWGVFAGNNGRHYWSSGFNPPSSSHSQVRE